MSSSPVRVTTLTCEYQPNPLGIDVLRPRLSWRLESDARDTRQTAYQIRVASSTERLTADDGALWDTGRVASDASTLREYAGPALVSGQRCYWQVRIWDGDGQSTPWSEPAWWEMGLLSPEDWQAAWIEPDLPEDTAVPSPAPLLRAEFAVDAPVASARLYATAHGVYALELNGQPVSDTVLAPGWTSYEKRLQYQTYDVTPLLRTGPNALGATLADGWHRGFVGWGNRRNIYGDKLALLAQLVITYADGRVQVFGTGPDWRASTGPILLADLQVGEHYDARLEKPGWSTPGYDASAWSGVRVADHNRRLVAPLGPPMRRIDEVKPIALLNTPAGDTVIDFGQNMVGWVRFKVSGPAGVMVSLRHAEVLDADGNLYVANLRGVAQTDRYTLKGQGEEIFEPQFTFHGFRYAAVEGYPGPLSLDAFTGIAVHSDLPRTGHFECDQPLINQLQRNIVWGQKGNFVDVPTDCPQRNERLGWTGDAQVFARTAAFNMQVAGFFTKWLRDLAADQSPDGRVPHVIPDIVGEGGSTGWGDAAVIVPWTLYLAYGDTRILEEQYASMAAWVGYMRQQAGDGYLWNSGKHYGDWLAVPPADSNRPRPMTDHGLLATAFFAYSTSLVARAARVLGRSDDAAEYEHWLAQIKAAFNHEFVTPSGRVSSNSQTAYVLALQFDLLPHALRAQAARRLVADIHARQEHLTTGFLGASFLPHALSENGFLDVAYALLEQTTYPSWLYPITQGATTIWERWDGLKPDGTFQDPGMNSFNHYAYGAIGEWLYRVVAGLDLDPSQPGYKRIVIRPQPGGSLRQARAVHESLYGRNESAWRRDDTSFNLTVIIPPNTEAEVHLPTATLGTVTEQGQPLTTAAGVRSAREADGHVIAVVGSGSYAFKVSSP